MIQRDKIWLPWRAVLAAALLLCLLLPSLAAAQSCRVPSQLMTLARGLAALPPQETRMSEVQAARLSAQLRGLSEAALLSDLAENGLDSLAGLAIDVLSEAERLSTAGAVYDPAQMRALLRELDLEATLICASLENGAFQEQQQERAGGLFTEHGVNWQEIERALEQEKATSLVAVVVLVGLIIGTLYTLDTGIRWLFALVYNRKVCRIPAELMVQGQSVTGLVVTLGRGGFRFHPLNTVAFDQVLDTLDCMPAKIDVDGATVLACRMTVLRQTVADFRFDTPLTLRQHRALLQLSTISPFYVRKARDGGEETTDSVV
jgi:hypothetical protein